MRNTSSWSVFPIQTAPLLLPLLEMDTQNGIHIIKVLSIDKTSVRFESSQGIFSGAEGFGRYSTAANHFQQIFVINWQYVYGSLSAPLLGVPTARHYANPKRCEVQN